MRDKLFSLAGTPGSLQLAFFAAMLSVIFQNWDDYYAPLLSLPGGAWWGMILGCALYAVPALRQSGLLIFIAGCFLSFFSHWSTAANHSWLAIWTLVPAAFMASWWTSMLYAQYLRYTMGIVMIAAGLQKIIAGTYLDGSYIAWLSFRGSTTEQMFGFLCSGHALVEPCLTYQLIGAGLILWQLVVGVLLLLGLRALWVLVVEIGFLLGAGVFADEMNFQVLNIAILTIIFRTGMPLGLFILCVAFLLADVVGLGEIYTMLQNL